MNKEMEELIDVLLRDQFEGPVPDDGFCDSVMNRLPVRRHRYNWLIGAGILNGMATCWFSLWSAPIAYVGWRDWLSGDLSASVILLFGLMMSMAILALAWAIAEADDRCDPSSRRVIR